MRENADIHTLIDRTDLYELVIRRLTFNGGQITVADMNLLESARRDVREIRARHHFATDGASPHDFAS